MPKISNVQNLLAESAGERLSELLTEITRRVVEAHVTPVLRELAVTVLCLSTPTADLIDPRHHIVRSHPCRN